MMNPDIAAAYPRVPGYLDTASYGLPARATVAALKGAADNWAAAATDIPAADDAVDRMRAAYATLVGARARDIAFAGSVSQVVGMVAASLPAGARVLAVEGDFSSVLFPFIADPRIDVTLVTLDQLVDAVVPGIDLVAVSAVQSADGRVADLTGLAMAARIAGAHTLIDASHAAGWLPLHARDFDVVVSAAYKWLNAPRGITLAAIHPEATWIRPVNASWYGADKPWEALYGPPFQASVTARRFDTSPPWQLAEAGAIALEILARQDVTKTYAYVVDLANAFRDGMGLAPSTSAIVSVPGVDPRDLAAAGVRASARSGRARLGFYVYNDEDDALAALRALHSRVRQPA
jgi:selenocysteine lyase/cysteine desulfurase